jgi:signal transduction histidine kinase
LKQLNDILDYARCETETVCNRMDSIESALFFHRLLSDLPTSTPHATVPVEIRIAEDFPTVFQCDQKFLMQILFNLLQNAQKFTRQGTIELIAEMSAADNNHSPERDSPEKRILAIRVRDTGIGIPEEHLNKIFEPFYQVDASSTRNFGGIGLGLALVKSLSRLINAELRVKSTPGRGSEFTLRLPYVVAPSLDVPLGGID